MTSLKTSIKTITYLSDIGCLEIQGASLEAARGYEIFEKREEECRKVILVPGAQSAEAAQKAVSGLVNAMPGGTI